MKHLQRIFKVLSNPRRLAVVALLLRRRELSVGTIAQTIGLSFTATSKHLLALENADILEKRQESRMVYYRINRKAVSPTDSLLKLIVKAGG